MNESMNFGSIGFGNVSSANNSAQQETKSIISDNVTTQNNPPAKPDLMAGVKESQEEEERKRKEEEEAIKDFKSAHAKKTNFERDADNFSQIDFGPLKKYLDDDDITDISYSNNGQLWLKSLEKGVYRADQQDVDNELIEKIAFQCSNVMGKTFNMAHPFLDSESAELRMNFVHDSIARNGIAVVFRKTPAKIRLEKQKLLNEKYVQLSIHDFLINCVKGHCNIIVCGETGSGKTELIKYLASHTRENEKLITIEDTLELHLDRIFPQRDIVAMKTNNIASYSDVLVTCMRQNPIWILLSEVRSAEAVTAVRNSISSGHYILSTIHADKAESIPHRMYSLLESNIDVEQFLKTIYRYVQIGVFVRGRYKPEEKRFVREIAGVCEFFVTEDTNEPKFNNIYLKTVGGEETYQEPTKYIKNYLEGQGVDITNLFGEKLSSLAAANEANGIESEVKESNGEIVHIPGNPSTNTNADNKVEQKQEEVVEEPKTVDVPNNTPSMIKSMEPAAPSSAQPMVKSMKPAAPSSAQPMIKSMEPATPSSAQPMVKSMELETPSKPDPVENNIKTEEKTLNIEPIQNNDVLNQTPVPNNVLTPNPLPTSSALGNMNTDSANNLNMEANTNNILNPAQVMNNQSMNMMPTPNAFLNQNTNNNAVGQTNGQFLNTSPQMNNVNTLGPSPSMTNQQPLTQSKFFSGLIDGPTTNQASSIIS